MNIKTISCFVAIITIALQGLFSYAEKETEYNYPVHKSTQEYSFYQEAATTYKYPDIEDKQVKNIILLIGDGMGLAQAAATRTRLLGRNKRLYMEKCPYTGLMDTYSADYLVTDSAAAGTALATGIKTNNGIISMTPKEEVIDTILERASQKGLATGLVATSTITHATPASFAAHVNQRKKESEIAQQMVDSGVDVMLGGGKQYFIPKSMEHSKRQDDLNLLEDAKKKGFSFIETQKELKEATGPKVLGLFQYDALKVNGNEPTLAELTNKAIEILKKDADGFFLMVEGSQIDWACHGHAHENMYKQTLHFDLAVKEAIEFALKDKHTLVVITADHETAGLTINWTNPSSKELNLKWSSKGHTGVPVPIYAIGPYAKLLSGYKDNTDIPTLFAYLLNLQNFPRIRKK